MTLLRPANKFDEHLAKLITRGRKSIAWRERANRELWGTITPLFRAMLTSFSGYNADGLVALLCTADYLHQLDVDAS